MRARRTQFMNSSRLPKQFWFVCAKNTGISYDVAGMDYVDNAAISSPKYEEEYKWKRRTQKNMMQKAAYDLLWEPEDKRAPIFVKEK